MLQQAFVGGVSEFRLYDVDDLEGVIDRRFVELYSIQ